jgi:hypothetical protein
LPRTDGRFVAVGADGRIVCTNTAMARLKFNADESVSWV